MGDPPSSSATSAQANARRGSSSKRPQPKLTKSASSSDVHGIARGGEKPKKGKGMSLKKAVIGAVEDYFGAYIETLGNQDVSVGLWKGRLRLRNLKIKPQVLQSWECQFIRCCCSC